VRQAAASRALRGGPVVIVDHGGPSPASVQVRDQVAAAVRESLGADFGPVAAASMEAPEGARGHGPLLSQVLASPGFASGDVLIAPLFLSPGRHAGPGGDLAGIASEAQRKSPGLRCHFTELVGTHPLAIEALAAALAEALAPGVPR
jgi:sirohydrochlorin ferrochelatase